MTKSIVTKSFSYVLPVVGARVSVLNGKAIGTVLRVNPMVGVYTVQLDHSGRTIRVAAEVKENSIVQQMDAADYFAEFQKLGEEQETGKALTEAFARFGS